MTGIFSCLSYIKTLQVQQIEHLIHCFSSSYKRTTAYLAIILGIFQNFLPFNIFQFILVNPLFSNTRHCLQSPAWNIIVVSQHFILFYTIEFYTTFRRIFPFRDYPPAISDYFQHLQRVLLCHTSQFLYTWSLLLGMLYLCFCINQKIIYF